MNIIEGVSVVELSLTLAVISALGMLIVLIKHILMKRDLLKLKEEMKTYHLQNGFDNTLWSMFVNGTREILDFKK